MTELSLNILDVANNSVRARASQIRISVKIERNKDCLTIIIEDNGCGMTKEQLAQVEDPFYTSRTTRKVGLGVPFFKQAALSCEGTFSITSKVNIGTTVVATFRLSHIDRMPLGDINATIHTLITSNTEIDFIYQYEFDDANFTLDTRQMRDILGDISFDCPEVSAYIKEYLEENKKEVDGGINI